MQELDNVPFVPEDRTRFERLRLAASHVIDHVFDALVDGPFMPHNSRVTKKER